MVGNDVVDLSDAEAQPGARHPRFDERVFAKCERQLLGESRDERRLRWGLWAAKESAYKVARRRDPHTIFAPARFIVKVDADLRGRVLLGDEAFPVTIAIAGDCVHAVATDAASDPAEVISGVGLSQLLGDSSPAAPGRAARDLATVHVARKLRVPPESLELDRQRRAPRIRHREGRPAGCLSLSHHGRFVAYAWSSAAAERGDDE
jgi:hypothetical protein